MRKWTLYILLIILQINCSKHVVAQTIFYQEIFHGGITAGGFSTGMGIGSGIINLHIEQGSTIKKAFVFAFRTGANTSQSININNINYLFDSSNEIASFPFKNTYFSPIYLQCIDITKELNNALTSSFAVTIPNQPELPFKGVFAPFIYIAYENTALPLTNTSIIINEQSLMGNEYYSVNNLNPILTNYPVGFSLYTDRTDNISQGQEKVWFNGNLLGIIGGSDNVNNLWSYAGVKGHFYYHNNQLFGLDDDTPDVVMDSTDGLANVSSYLISNTTSSNFRLTHINYPNQPPQYTCVNLSYFFTYASPCTIIPAVVSSDTSICRGETVQLHASGGTKYEWKCLTDTLPYGNSVYGLSCKNCANPLFSGDSSAVYTVRVWNGDSCSVVRPVRVTVNPNPKGVFSTVNTQCDSATGVLKMQNNNSLQTFYAITGNDDTLQSNSQNIPQVGEGNYTVFYVDKNGCQSNDTVVKVDYFNNVQANFTVNPMSGAAPLSVQINNTSQNATSYQWSLDSVNIPKPPTVFYSSGTYNIQLIAYGTNPECNDTTFTTIFVYDSLVLDIPNVFTPNNDGINDVFTITSNLPVKAEIVILNRWGNEIHHIDRTLNVSANPIWDGTSTNSTPVTDGVYFYKIEVVDLKENSKEINGFFHLVK